VEKVFHQKYGSFPQKALFQAKNDDTMALIVEKAVENVEITFV
jgi:hypothetical protein